MEKTRIQQAFDYSYQDYCAEYSPTAPQRKVAHAVMACKTGSLGVNVSLCADCGHIETHSNSCRNRHCPSCQALDREAWVDSRKAEVVDAPYFHLVFTVPAELNPLIYANQALLYGLLHSCASETVLELAAGRKCLGAAPGVIQVLHTWGQELNFHPHIHCIIAGGGLTGAGRFIRSGPKFFLPVKALGKKFRGKFLAKLKHYYGNGRLSSPPSCKGPRNFFSWQEFTASLYSKDWIPYIKKTFNGFGNAIDYLGRYANRIAISNARILSVSRGSVTFWAKDYRTGQREEVTLPTVEFIRRFLMHVLPRGFRKIRYCGFLNSRYKKRNLTLISRLTGRELPVPAYASMGMAELLLHLYGMDIHICPACGGGHFHHVGRTYYKRE